MKLYGFGRPYLHHDHDHDHASLGSPHLSGLGNSLNSFRLDGSAFFFFRDSLEFSFAAAAQEASNFSVVLIGEDR